MTIHGPLAVSPYEDREHLDQQRIDLRVEARAEGTRRLRTTGQPSVYPIKRGGEQSGGGRDPGDMWRFLFADQSGNQGDEHGSNRGDLVRQSESIDRVVNAQVPDGQQHDDREWRGGFHRIPRTQAQGGAEGERKAGHRDESDHRCGHSAGAQRIVWKPPAVGRHTWGTGLRAVQGSRHLQVPSSITVHHEGTSVRKVRSLLSLYKKLM